MEMLRKVIAKNTLQGHQANEMRGKLMKKKENLALESDLWIPGHANFYTILNRYLTSLWLHGLHDKMDIINNYPIMFSVFNNIMDSKAHGTN